MLVKDQIRARMEELNVSVRELQDRIGGISNQTVRYWLDGRNLPRGRNKEAVEDALSFRIDWTERGTYRPVAAAEHPVALPRAASEAPPDVDRQREDIETFVRFQRLPAEVKDAIALLIDEFESALESSKRPTQSVFRAPYKRK